MNLRNTLYLLAVIAIVFITGFTGRWDNVGYMLDGAVLMLLYLKGKEK